MEKCQNILLIEDEEYHVELIERGFEDFDNYNLIAVDSFNLALDKINNEHIDLIITDLRIPDGNGISFLKENKIVESIPVIVMTSFGDQKIAVEAMKAGALDYIVKSPESLLSMPTSAKFVLKEWKHLCDKEIANREIRDMQEKFNLFMNKLPAGVFIKDQKQKIVFTNKYFKDNFDADNLSDNEILKIDMLDNMGDFLNADVVDGENNIETNIIETRNKNKEKKIFHTHNFAFKNHSEQKFQAGIALDITKQKEVEKELIDAKVRAEESDKLKTAFLANISHEIRTPMNAILGFSELLRASSNKQGADYIDIITINTRKLLQIITDIVDIAKIEAGKISVYKETFNLNEILYDIYADWNETRKISGKEHISFNLKCDLSDENALIETDMDKLKRIFNNLINNAFKFTENGSINFGYKCKDDKSVLFFVKDTGIGLPEDKLNIVFEHFRQVEESFTRKFGGVGLGLTISKAMVDLLDGKIWVVSNEKEGAELYFELPLKVEGKNVELDNGKSHFNWNGKTILVVEDEYSNFQYINEVLEPTCVKIIHITNGKEAVDYCLENQDYDLILMDIKLPIINGLDVTKLIKTAGVTQPIIAQTAYAMADDIQKCKEAGCESYIAKPIKATEFLKLIDKYI